MADSPHASEHTYVDAEGVTIHYTRWEPAADVPGKGVVQIVHGLGEHSGRYQLLAGELTAAGYTVYADDHRGHGRTGMQQWGGDPAMLGRLGPGGVRATNAAVYQLSGIIRAENAGAPLVLLGHSWGSVIAQDLLNRHSTEYDAVILTGTAYRTLQHMNSRDLNANHRTLGDTGYEWLSRDPAIARAFVDDPLTFTANTVRLFGVREGLKLLGKPGRDLPGDPPLLIQVGSDDSLGGTRSVELLAEAYLQRSGFTDVELIIYTDARHEVFNETNRLEVVADTIGWLESRLGAIAPA